MDRRGTTLVNSSQSMARADLDQSEHTRAHFARREFSAKEKICSKRTISLRTRFVLLVLNSFVCGSEEDIRVRHSYNQSDDEDAQHDCS